MRIPINSLTRLYALLLKYSYNIILFWISYLSIFLSFKTFFSIINRPIETGIWSTLFLHLTSSLLVCLPFLFFKQKKALFLLYLCILNLYLLSNLIYFRTYFTLLPFDSYTMAGNLGDLYDSILSGVHAGDFWLFAPYITVVMLYYLYFRKKIVRTSFTFRSSCMVLIIFLSSGIITYNLYLEKDQVSNLLSDENEFKYDVIDGASTYGFAHCWFWQFKTTFGNNHPITTAEQQRIERFIQDENKLRESGNIRNQSGKNIIFLLIESLESFPINQHFYGQELTPTLNSLIRRDSCYYASNMIPQVNIGHSSDAQLIFNSGMLPPLAGAACFKYQHNTYLTLAQALEQKGYRCSTLLGGNGSFWNQGVMNKTLGYNQLIDIDQFIDDESYEFGLTDSTFLSQSADKIKQFKQPFMAQLVTLSSHDPYRLIDDRQYLKQAPECPKELFRYLNAIHYVDKSIGEFINKLKQMNLMHNTVIIITGDHQATKQAHDKWQTYIRKKWGVMIDRTPLLIINGGIKATDHSVCGQIDLYPTLLEMFGLEHNNWKGLGRSLFDSNRTSLAVNAHFEAFSDCKQVISGSLQAKDLQRAKQRWEISDLMIRKDYFKHCQINQ